AHEVALPVAQRRRAVVQLHLAAVVRPQAVVPRLRPGPELRTQGAHEWPLLWGNWTALLVARGIVGQTLAQRQLVEVGRGGVQTEDAAGRWVLPYQPPLCVPDSQTVCDRLED